MLNFINGRLPAKFLIFKKKNYTKNKLKFKLSLPFNFITGCVSNTSTKNFLIIFD